MTKESSVQGKAKEKDFLIFLILMTVIMSISFFYATITKQETIKVKIYEITVKNCDECFDPSLISKSLEEIQNIQYRSIPIGNFGIKKYRSNRTK